MGFLGCVTDSRAFSSINSTRVAVARRQSKEVRFSCIRFPFHSTQEKKGYAHAFAFISHYQGDCGLYICIYLLLCKQMVSGSVRLPAAESNPRDEMRREQKIIKERCVQLADGFVAWHTYVRGRDIFLSISSAYIYTRTFKRKLPPIRRIYKYDFNSLIKKYTGSC